MRVGFARASSVLLLVCIASTGRAQALRFADILTDNMVLQRGKPVTVWGEGPADGQVQVMLTQSREQVVGFAGEAALARAEGKPPKTTPHPLVGDVRVSYVEEAPVALETVVQTVDVRADGRWEADLGIHAASFTPVYLAATSGDTGIAIKNLLVGEVWIASGQSNMEWAWTRDKMWENRGLVFNAIRYAKVRGASTAPRESFVDDAAVQKGRAFEPWIVCEDGAVDRVSTVAYLYAQYLHRRLKVPVGVINIAQGGSFAREWCARDLLAQMDSPTVDAHLADFAAKQKTAEAVNWRGGPAELFNARLYPIRKMTVAGVIYMQGENESLGGALPQYGKTLPGVIQSYREALSSPELPFGIITLQGYGGYAVAREIHLQTHRKTPNTGYIVAHDIGGNIHPSWKRPLSERAVYWALRDVYGVLDGVKRTRIKGVTFAEGQARVEFEQQQLKAGQWLEPRPAGPQVNDQQRVAGFDIAGADRVWYRGRVRQEGNVVVLHHPLVAKPVALRYGWGGFPCGNLGSWEDPVPPYRTDDWPIVADDAVAAGTPGERSPAEINYLKGHERRNSQLENGLKLAIVDSREQLIKRYAHPKGILLKTAGNMQELMQGFDAEQTRARASELQRQALHSIPCRYWRRDRYTPARRAKWGWLIERVIRLETLPREMDQALQHEAVATRIAQLQKALDDLQQELSELPDAEEMTVDTMLDKVLPMMEQEKERLTREDGLDMTKQGRELNRNPF